MKPPVILPFLLAAVLAAAPAAAADCAREAEALAARQGAVVLRVSAVAENGRTVCVIRLRIPGTGGQPPRVEEVRLGG